MKYVNQREYPHWLYTTRIEQPPEEREIGKTSTIKSSGCGLCSAVMVADRLLPNSDFGLKDALELSYANKANPSRGTNYKRFAPAFAEKHGFEYEMTSDPERLRFCLRTGGAAVLHGKGDREGYTGVFSENGHYVVAVSEERDGRIAVLDPDLYEGKFEKEGRKGKVELKDEVIALCDIDVIVEDTAPANPSFYLFWRK